MAEPMKVPASDAPAEEWGRLAVSLPGWRWVAGMRDIWDRCAVPGAGGGIRWVSTHPPDDLYHPNYLPDPDDPATAGCLLALLGKPTKVDTDWGWRLWTWDSPTVPLQPNLGRACIATAAALGRWPGGEG